MVSATRLATSAVAIVVGAAGCSGSGGHSASTSTTRAPTPTTVVTSTVGPAPTTTTASAAIRHIALPTDPCSVLTAAQVRPVVGAASVAIARPAITSPTISSVGCTWRSGATSLTVEITAYTGGDPYAYRLRAVRGGRDLPGLGDQAVETDSLSANQPTKDVVILVRIGDVAVQVTAQVFGQTTVDRVSVATQAVLGRL